ncbi:MAG: PrsW family intramembrane metalloprotease [Chloroflexota bacterium]|nr:PrsW family intramembrane metalloprotease [Chloroflexota bacterium]
MLTILIILFLSFAPMLLYAFFLWWLDRYEKEPWLLLAFSFFWGALPAVILSVILELLFDIPNTAFASNHTLIYNLLGGAVTAPLVEESLKAVAVLGLLIFFPREIDSPIDGVIYGGMAGFGFAAVENLLYFITAYGDGGLIGTFWLAFLRAGVFGLNHAMYTGFTGLGIALALEYRQRWFRWLLPPLGLSLAVFIHAYHNTLATFWSHLENGASLFVAIISDWSGVLLLILVAIWARWLEQGRLVAFLNSQAATYQIPAEELAILISPRQREKMRWQALFRGNFQQWFRLGRYFQLITEAAFSWHRAGQGDVKSAADLGEIAVRLREVQGQVTSLKSKVVG